MTYLSVPSAITDIRFSTISINTRMSNILLGADWPNFSLQAVNREGLIKYLPKEYGFFTSYLSVMIFNRIPSEVNCRSISD